MKVIVIEDGWHIGRVSDEDKGCAGCTFETTEIIQDKLVHTCGLDSNTKMPCVDTIYALVKDDEDEDDDEFVD